MSRIKIVIDSNVYISAILFGGKPEKIVELARLDIVEAFVTVPILEEVLRVLQYKFGWNKGMLGEAAATMPEAAMLIEPTEKISVIQKDRADDKILEAAVASGADFIISGDSHLLELKRFRSIKIVDATEFLHLIITHLQGG